MNILHIAKYPQFLLGLNTDERGKPEMLSYDPEIGVSVDR